MAQYAVTITIPYTYTVEAIDSTEAEKKAWALFDLQQETGIPAPEIESITEL